MKHHTRDKAYEYTITFMKYGKIKTMTMEAESREDALLLFQSRIEEIQANTGGRYSESKRIAAGTADGKPDGQAENV